MSATAAVGMVSYEDVLCRMRHTVGCDTCNFRLARRVDFLRLQANVSRTHLTDSAGEPGRSVRLETHSQPVALNLLYHA